MGILVKIAVLGAIATAMNGCAPRYGGLSPTELAAAMADSMTAWSFFPSDGTARADTARRLATYALWDIEGGDRERGLRVIAAVRALGLVDSVFHKQAALAYQMVGEWHKALGIYEEAQRLWPTAAWPHLRSAPVLRRLQRSTEADSAEATATRLERKEAD